MAHGLTNDAPINADTGRLNIPVKAEKNKVNVGHRTVCQMENDYHVTVQRRGNSYARFFGLKPDTTSNPKKDMQTSAPHNNQADRTGHEIKQPSIWNKMVQCLKEFTGS